MVKIILKVFVFCVFWMFTTEYTMAQNTLWTLQQCVDTALKNNLTVQQSTNTVELNKINLSQSKTNLFPTFSGSAEQSFSSGNLSKSIWSNNFSVNSSVTLFNGFQKNNTIKQGQLDYEASKYDMESKKNDIVLSVVDAYLQVLYAEELIKNATNEINATKSQLDKTEQFVIVGKKSESDLLQIKSQLASDKLSLINAQGQLKSAKLILQQVMNITVFQSFDITYPLIIEPQKEGLADVNEIYNQALSLQPSIRAYQLKTQSVIYGIKINKGAMFPHLSLSGNLGANYNSDETATDNPIKSLFMSLSVPIFNNYQIKNNIQTQKINLKNALLEEQSVRNELRKNIEQAYINVENADAKFIATKEQVDASYASYQNANTKYENGMMSTSELLQELNKFTRAQSEYIQARYELIYSMKILDYYKGVTLNF